MAPSTITRLTLLPLALLACNDVESKVAEVEASVRAPEPATAEPATPKLATLEPATLDGRGGGTRSVQHEAPCPDPAREQPPTLEMCPPERQIAPFPNQDCPVPPAPWTVSKLAAPLDRYCRYIWTGNAPADLGVLPGNVKAAMGPDCRVQPQSPLRTTLAGDFERAFAEGTQPLKGKGELAGGQHVTIAVVDTAPRSTTLGAAAHGPTLAALAARIASGCAPGLGGSACAREVQTFLGLPQTLTGPDRQAGGYFGYQSDLAEGIVAALDTWANKDHKFVLNLSVGWEPSLGDLTGQFDERGGLAVVRDAVGLAHCQGALVVAASGNRPRGSCVDAATGPGSWEAHGAWTAAQCQGLGLANNQIKLPTGAYNPFVFAATPLTWGERNLADFRPGSNARLAAVGFSAADTRLGQYGPMTGSSISTTVIAGTAALVWSYFPTLAADELMQLIYDSGDPRREDGTTVLASHYLHSPSAPSQHVITACGALIHACDQAGQAAPSECTDARARCSSYAPNQSVDEATWWHNHDAALAQLPPSERQSGTVPAWKAYECVSCGQPSIAELPRGRQIAAEDMTDAWILPQPEKGPCPVCTLKGPDLHVTLDPVYDNAVNGSATDPSLFRQLDNVTITLHDSAGNTEALNYGVPVPTLSSSYVQTITDPQLTTVDIPGASTGAPPVSATVTMHFTTGTGKRIKASNQIPAEP